jgi:hypothetical protein
MRTTEVIEAYIEDVGRLLPGRQRVDVAAELRSLLNEELQARARESGRPADEALALSLVRSHGAPNEVAARYQTAWTVIEPADSTSFLRAALIGGGVLIVLSALSRRHSVEQGPAGDIVNTAIFTWLGFLVAVFAARSWLRRRRPATWAWTPRDRDRVSRLGTAAVVLMAAVFVTLYAAPVWVLDHVSGGRMETSWATYTDDFQRLRLPLVIGLMISLLGLQSFVAIEGRWRRLTRRVNIGLNMALAGLMLTLAVDGDVFESSVVDQIAKGVLTLVAVIYIPSVGVMLYCELGRIDRAVGVARAA